jgi:hypothetical protein
VKNELKTSSITKSITYKSYDTYYTTMVKKLTTITLWIETKADLTKEGKFGESYNDIIRRMLAENAELKKKR